MQLCEQVRHEVPTDEQLLGTMTIFYRRANCLQNMSAAFAAACAAHPRDEGLLRGVFTCYVRQVVCKLPVCSTPILQVQSTHDLPCCSCSQTGQVPDTLHHCQPHTAVMPSALKADSHMQGL